MALICLASASGAPGVTTTALALAFNWPHPVMLVDADPSGASAIRAGIFRAHHPSGGDLMSLAMSHRQGTLATDLPHATVPPPDGTTTVAEVGILLGARSHDQAVNLAGLWDPLALHLKGLGRAGTDVIIDAGRLGAEGSPAGLLRASDLLVLVTRTTLPALNGVRGWMPSLTASHADPHRLGLLLIGEGHPYKAGEISTQLKVPVIASIDFDPVSAEVYHLGASPRPKFAKAPLTRSVLAAVSALQTALITRENARITGQPIFTPGRSR